MSYDYDIGVFIGRMQIVHNGHIHVITEALKKVDKLLVLIGSATSPRCHRNPFTFTERMTMLKNSVSSDIQKRLIIKPLEDATYNDSKWIQNVQNAVERTAWEIGHTNEPRVALVGHAKDHTSYYLNLFPQWGSISVTNHRNISSTQIRNSYFSNIGHMWINDADGHKIGDLPQDHVVSTPVKKFLENFINTSDYKNIREEYEFAAKYKSSWNSAPYPVNLVTTDALVVKSGHILLVKRGARPGIGLYALPGGYLNVTERAVDGMIRELREETKLKVPESVLRGSIVRHEIFDDPNRSSRGRVMTVAYYIDLGIGPLDKVKGGDDARDAFWLPLSDLSPDKMFEDHFYIIQAMLGI